MKLQNIVLIIISVALCVYLYLIRFDLYTSYKLRNCIVWSENYEVGIDDFEMTPNLHSEINLYYWHGINLKSNAFGNAKSSAIFDKKKSWIKDTSKFDYKTELEFQKLMFDLTEVYSRKLNNRIKVLKYANYDTGLHFKKLENEFWIINKKYESRRDEILTEKEKSISDKIIHWRPIINEMLKNEE